MSDMEKLRSEYAELGNDIFRAVQRFLLAHQLQKQTPPSSAEHRKASEIVATAVSVYVSAQIRRAGIESILDPSSPEAIERARWKALDTILKKERSKPRSFSTDEAPRGRMPRDWKAYKSAHTPPG